MRLVALIGEPATGKSTLAREVYDRLSAPTPFKLGLVSGTYHRVEKTFVLGSYGPGIAFQGTDRLSMGVQPKAIEFLRQQAFLLPSGVVFFEGDRLGTASFFDAAAKICELRVFCLQATEEAKRKRHLQRADTQTETFLKSRATKVSNILKLYPQVTLLQSASPADIADNAGRLLQAIKD